VVGAGSPTPPSGTWPPPPYPGWGAGSAAGAAPGGGWSDGPGAPPPPFGGWPPPQGFPAPPPAPRRRSGLVAAMAAVFAVVAVLAGAGLGHFVWPSSTTSAVSTPNELVPGGSSGSGSSPFGSGSSGSEGSPFGGSGSTGSGSSGGSSTGAGAPSDISAIAAKVDPGLVDINTNLSYEDEQAAGTGMVLTSSGEILTNNHVIDGATSISVTDVGTGKTYTAKVVGYDRTGDVAVIRLVGASGLRTVSTSTGTAAVGQAVVGVGNAGGTGGTPSAAGGSITAMGQSITASDDGGGNSENLTGLIETNAGIQPGDSGGSLVNTSGQVIGMDTAASVDSGYETSGSQGYAIPIGTALSIAKRIEAGDASSTVHIGATGFLGVSVQSSSAAGGAGGFGGSGFGGGDTGGTGGTGGGGTGTSGSGADVEGTLSGSPAARAGLVQGDVITAVNGNTVTSSSALSNILEPYHPGDQVQLQWTNSSGQTQTASVTLESGPPA
jgi:S1-C subfamily serine protease